MPPHGKIYKTEMPPLGGCGEIGIASDSHSEGTGIEARQLHLFYFFFFRSKALCFDFVFLDILFSFSLGLSASSSPDRGNTSPQRIFKRKNLVVVVVRGSSGVGETVWGVWKNSV